MDTNALATSTSPYLLAHANQPVAWQPWGSAAFDEARRRGVPVLVSIGYSTCHWCHVMARESFSDPETAAVINAGFVAIKVDREELPGVDEYYMTALQALRGHGGWPLTAFANHDGVPFFAGTYYPPVARHGLPCFRQVLDAVTATWHDRRLEVDAVTTRLGDQLRGISAGMTPVRETGKQAGKVRTTSAKEGTWGAGQVTEEIQAWYEELATQFDHIYGGFGPAPKFPPSMVLSALTALAVRPGVELIPGREPLTMVRATFEGIRAGGMRDHLRGGIARYSTDARWQVPHFEKMLRDNAMYLRATTDWWRVENHREPGSAYASMAAAEVAATAGFILTDLRLPSGGFAVGLDADSVLGGAGGGQAGTRRAGQAGVEGAYYTFTATQVRQAEEAGAEAGAGGGQEAGQGYFDLVPFEDGGVEDGEPRQVLIVPGAGTVAGNLVGVVVERLRKIQADRTPPARDDKLITEDTCLAATALIRAGVVLDEPEWIAAGVEAVRAVLGDNVAGGENDLGEGLLRSSTAGRPGPGGAGLADYAAVIRVIVELQQVRSVAEVGGDDDWAIIRELTGQMVRRFLVDAETGEVRVRDYVADGPAGGVGANLADSVVPSGRAAATEVLALLAGHDPVGEYGQAEGGEQGGQHEPEWELSAVLEAVMGMGRTLMPGAPTVVGWQVLTELRGALRVETSVPELARVALSHPSSPQVWGAAAGGGAVVCVGQECLLPVHTEEALREQLDKVSKKI